MRWRSVAIAGALWPAAAGCNIAHNAARNIINEPHVVWTQHAIKHDLKQAAKAAWEASRFECPEHADSAAFRDGFIDGYVDYLDRGGNGSMPAVPPAKYTRHKEYFTENGQCLVKEYFFGFKHGSGDRDRHRPASGTDSSRPAAAGADRAARVYGESRWQLSHRRR